MEAYFLLKYLIGIIPQKLFFAEKNSLEKLLTSSYLFNIENYFFSLFF